jgi:hypothetical protein
MTPCKCAPGTCARDSGALPAKSRDVLCRARVVVPRHEPTIPKPTHNLPGRMEAVHDDYFPS